MKELKSILAGILGHLLVVSIWIILFHELTFICGVTATIIYYLLSKIFNE